MFVWLASYPKSGNTLTRSLFSSYFFSEDGNFSLNLIENIRQFPDFAIFNKLNIDTKNEKEVIRNYLNAQSLINIKEKTQFLKTHSYLFNIENNPFTDLQNTLGVIYIVRDPRNVVLSASHYYQETHEKTVDHMTKGHVIGKNDGIKPIVYCGTWSGNFNSWKSFKSVNRYLLIKYEDLIKDKEGCFYKMLEFIHMLNKVDFVLDKKKFYNTLKSTNFENLQNLEKKYGFKESMKNKKTGKKIKFFNSGKNTNWENTLDNKLRIQIEEAFEKEMIELSYL